MQMDRVASDAEVSLKLLQALMALLQRRGVIGINDIENLIAGFSLEAARTKGSAASACPARAGDVLRGWLLEADLAGYAMEAR